jgi:hypothetical protein
MTGMVVGNGGNTLWAAYLRATLPMEAILLEKTLQTVAVGRRRKPGRPRRRPRRLIAIEAMQVTRWVPTCSPGHWARHPRSRQPYMAMYQTATGDGATRGGGLCSGSSPGWATFGASSCPINGLSPCIWGSFICPKPCGR